MDADGSGEMNFGAARASSRVVGVTRGSVPTWGTEPRVERPSMESSGVLFTAEEVERARRYHRTRPTSEKVVKAFAVSSGFGPYFAVTHGSVWGAKPMEDTVVRIPLPR